MTPYECMSACNALPTGSLYPRNHSSGTLEASSVFSGLGVKESTTLALVLNLVSYTLLWLKFQEH